MQNIKAIIFDVDGTLYNVPQVSFQMKNHWMFKIAKKFKISEKKAEKKYLAMKKKYGSTTEGLRKLGFGALEEISYETQKIVNRKENIKKDARLIKVAKSLGKKYQLFLLRNGMKDGTVEVLKLLGFSKEEMKMFKRNFSTIEDFGVMKPNLKPFRGIIKYTKLKPSEHLIIGDRIDVDLSPAKKLGMKTALVTWGNKTEKSKDVDFYIDTIYDAENILKRDCYY